MTFTFTKLVKQNRLGLGLGTEQVETFSESQEGCGSVELASVIHGNLFIAFSKIGTVFFNESTADNEETKAITKSNIVPKYVFWNKCINYLKCK